MSRLSIHANLVVINGMGTLIRGEPHLGKSELSLMLLDRGHALVADDAVELENQKGILFGHCPIALQGFMQIDFVGIINLEKRYGPHALLAQHSIDMVIHLKQDFAETLLENPLKPVQSSWECLKVSLPEFQLPNTGKGLVLLIEALAHNCKLQKLGYDVYQDFLSKADACNKKS